MATTTTLRWTKCPRDGTSFSYWEAPGGWLICTRPGSRYALEVPSAWRPGVCLRFDTLAQAQAAAEWPRHELLTALREAYEQFVALLVGSACPDVLLPALHERAADEDLTRQPSHPFPSVYPQPENEEVIHGQA